jgi:hypothetical protein
VRSAPSALGYQKVRTCAVVAQRLSLSANADLERIMPRVIEMRTYKTKPGKRDEFLALFRAKSVPKHQQIGMTIVGPLLSIEDADTFFWMRIFPDAAARPVMKDQFYEGALWKTDLESILLPMLDKYDVVLVDDPDNVLGAL